MLWKIVAKNQWHLLLSHQLQLRKDILNYVNKEALAIILAETKFHQYSYGQNSTIISDHKSLKHLLNKKGRSYVWYSITTHSPTRIQCYALILSVYQYFIYYKPGQTHNQMNWQLYQNNCPGGKAVIENKVTHMTLPDQNNVIAKLKIPRGDLLIYFCHMYLTQL